MFKVGDRVMIVDAHTSSFFDAFIQLGDVGIIESTDHKSMLTGKALSTIRLTRNNAVRSLYDERLVKI